VRSACPRVATVLARFCTGPLGELFNRPTTLRLDAPVRELLTAVTPAAYAAVVTEPVRLVITPGGRSRRWAKVWKTLDHASVLTRVSVEVDEDDDCEVAARVDTELIGRGVPPWIEHRRNGEVVDAATDAAERREFLGAMARSIELVVTHQEIVPRP